MCVFALMNIVCIGVYAYVCVVTVYVLWDINEHMNICRQ